MEFRIAPPRRVRRPRSPSAVLVSGFAIVIAVGTVLLALPMSSAAGTWTPPLDALFTSTSAVCVTGLALVDTGIYWSPFGQLVLLVLMQLGGFGFMTGSTLLLLLLVGRRTALRDRILAQASTGVSELGSVTGGHPARRDLHADRRDPGAIAADGRLPVRRPRGRPATGGLVGRSSTRSPPSTTAASTCSAATRAWRTSSATRWSSRPLGVLILLGQSRFRDRRRHRGQAALAPARARDAGRRPHDAGDPRGRDRIARRCSSGPIRPRLAACRRVRGRSTRCSRPRPFGPPASARSRRSSCATRRSSSSWR